MTVVDAFLSERHPPQSAHHILQTYLYSQRRRGISPHTLNRIYYNLKPIADAWEPRPFCDMDRTWLREYVQQQWTYYAPDTMRTKIGDIRAFCKWVKKKKHHELNLAKRIRPVRRKPYRRKRAAAVPEADIRKVFDHLCHIVRPVVTRDSAGNLQPNREITHRQVYAIRDLFILAFLYETGARVGELARLGTSAMNAATAVRQDVYLVTMYGKTADRDRRFTHHTAELWQLWQTVRPAAAVKNAVVGWSNSSPVQPLAASAISTIILRRSAAAGVRPFRANALRHAKAKRARKIAGLEMASILLDHAHIDTTREYANIEPNEVNAAAKQTSLQAQLL